MILMKYHALIMHYFFGKLGKMSQNLYRGCVTQLITCLTTDVCLAADPGIASAILTRSHTFVEIDGEIISTILFPSADSFKKGCRQLEMLSRLSS